jgi:hypothetical protein
MTASVFAGLVDADDADVGARVRVISGVIVNGGHDMAGG